MTVVFSATLVLAWAPAAWAAAPMLTSLTPASATSGGASFTMTINGMNFTPSSAAKWNATQLTTIYISDTELTAAVPASLIASAGGSSITVTTEGGVSSGISFIIDPPSPSIYGRNPAMANRGPDLGSYKPGHRHSRNHLPGRHGRRSFAPIRA